MNVSFEILNKRFVRDPCDTPLALPLIQQLRRRGDLEVARQVCKTALSCADMEGSFHPFAEALGGVLKQLILLLSLLPVPVRGARKWHRVTSFSLTPSTPPLGQASPKILAIAFVPKGTRSAGLICGWSHGLIDTLNFNADTPQETSPPGSVYPQKLISNSNTGSWLAIEKEGRFFLQQNGEMLFSGRNCTGRAHLNFATNTWLIPTQNGQLRLLDETPSPKTGAPISRIWRPPGIFAHPIWDVAQNSKGDRLTILHRQSGLMCFSGFGTLYSHLLHIDESAWMAQRARLSSDGTRAIYYDPWGGIEGVPRFRFFDQNLRRDGWLPSPLSAPVGWVGDPTLSLAFLWDAEKNFVLMDMFNAETIFKGSLPFLPFEVVWEPSCKFLLCISEDAKVVCLA